MQIAVWFLILVVFIASVVLAWDKNKLQRGGRDGSKR